jgi:addiction module RelE/StbE family toxin
MPATKRSRKGRARLKVVWTEYALRDLERIDSYIARDSPAAAARWVGKLIATAAALASAPMSGRTVPEKGRTDIREVLQRHYRIVYRIRKMRIDILTVFEGHKQLPSSAVPEDD